MNIGLVGLAVMGQNLVLNLLDHGYSVVVNNRTASKTQEFVENNPQRNLDAAYSLSELVEKLSKPRKVMLMVKAGDAVDTYINDLIKILEPGDIIIDGGNSNFEDTNRRADFVRSKGIYFLGAGVSGGEEGARCGPSIMPGGHIEAWEYVKEMFQSIAAKVDNDQACCEWVGENGAGHFVKMVHNGIEYGDMQLIVESYYFMRYGLNMPISEVADVFTRWNTGKLDSYLIEITSHILKVKDTDGEPLIDKILDVAGQKGTGKWTVISALETGIPVTLISEAVFARFLSSLRQERITASKIYKLDLNHNLSENDLNSLIDSLEDALYASKIISYSQGFSLMKSTAEQYNWNLNYGSIALMWRGGCIIRSAFLSKIKDAFKVDIENLLLDDFFISEIKASESSWREIVRKAVTWGIAMPGMTSALSFFDGYRTEFLPANLIQAQRDYFGAHGYKRLDSDKDYHTNWIDLVE
jgi:6-phosphogluconate dehydrogenase